MTERIQRVLDGELSRQRLTPEEAAELVAYEHAIRDAVDGLSPASVPDASGQVLQEIGTSAPSEGMLPAVVGTVRRMLGWIWAPRPIAVRPAYGVLAVVAALGLAVFAPPSVRLEHAASPGTPKVLVHFRIDAPGASAVRLAGDFSAWQPVYSLHESSPGVWSVVAPIEPGVHHYAFSIDGDHWVPDPHAPQVDDGFGGMNSRLAVLLPESQEAR